MQTQITARHCEANPMLRDYASRQISRLERFYDGITDVRIVLSSDNIASSPKLAEITLGVYRQRLTARDTASTHEQAIDGCVERLRRQILRYKGKRKSTNRDFHH